MKLYYDKAELKKAKDEIDKELDYYLSGLTFIQLSPEFIDDIKRWKFAEIIPNSRYYATTASGDDLGEIIYSLVRLDCNEAHKMVID